MNPRDALIIAIEASMCHPLIENHSPQAEEHRRVTRMIEAAHIADALLAAGYTKAAVTAAAA